MANTNIKLFDENKSNMMSDIDYGKDTQRANGVQTGLASSQLQNKFQYQMSLMAYAVAQLMIANGYDAMDSADVSTFVGNFSNSVVQKVKDKASASEAEAGTNDLKWISAKQLVDVATTIANKAAKGAVKYNTKQTLTDTQKAQAQSNIGAATVDHNHYGRVIEPTSVEIFPGTSAGHGGYVDFHYNSNTADYTSRLIEAPSGHVQLNGMDIMTRANIAAAYNVQAQFTNGIFEYSNSVIKAGTVCFAQFRGGLVTSSFRDTALSTSSEAGKVKIVAKNGETFKTTVNVLMINL